GALLGASPSSLREAQPPAAKVRVRPEGAEDIVSAPDEQPPHRPIARLRNPQLWFITTRIALAGPQAEIRPDGSARGKPLRIFECQDVGQCGHRPYAGNLAQSSRLRI